MRYTCEVKTVITDQRGHETESLLWTHVMYAEVSPKMQVGHCFIVAALHFRAFCLVSHLFAFEQEVVEGIRLP